MFYVKKGLLILGALLLLIQLIRPAKNQNINPQPNTLSTILPVPVSLQKIWNTSCTDCHSNYTKYPWYANVMPVGWVLANHINEGKQKFNFDAFATYNKKKQLHKLEELSEVLQDNYMPMNSYTIFHKNAILTEPQKNEIRIWVKQSLLTLLRDSIAALAKK